MKRIGRGLGRGVAKSVAGLPCVVAPAAALAALFSLAVVVVSLSVLLAAQPAQARVATSHSPAATWVAHSAYGLQVSVP